VLPGCLPGGPNSAASAVNRQADAQDLTDFVTNCCHAGEATSKGINRPARIMGTRRLDHDDLAAYLGIVRELGADRVLDVGCGTGFLAVLLADAGHTVVGADPAAASVEVARSKDPAGRITLVSLRRAH
jgi:2-polyprenyl-3-methyl-5-hydroxy-6-metoxy-1,4-benzoquinol methylase